MPPLTALIVDDDPAVRDTLQFLLELEGFEIRTAADGPAGLMSARHSRPSIIILDVMMPGLDGHAVARELRSDPSLTDVPIIFCSALTDERQIWEGWRAGADSYLPKPFDPEHLIAEVRRILEALRPGRSPAAPASGGGPGASSCGLPSTYDLGSTPSVPPGVEATVRTELEARRGTTAEEPRVGGSTGPGWCSRRVEREGPRPTAEA